MSRLENFLKLYKSKSTAKNYRYCVHSFLRAIYKEAADVDNGKMEEYADRYFNEKRNVSQDITNFLTAINDRPPKTVRLMLASVKSFLIENEVELPSKFWRRLLHRVRGNRALTLDKVPSNLELRKILTHTPVHGRALFLMLSSSGMRIGETLALNVDDIELDSEPAKVNVRGQITKTGNSRICFMSREAVFAVQEWLKGRDRYLVSASGKSHRYGKSKEDLRLFPFENSTAYIMWRNAVKHSGLSKKDLATNRFTLHPHVLRKFFRTRMATLIPVDIVEALMGHEEYLTEVYRRYSQEELAKFYQQGEAALGIFAEGEEIGKLRVEVEERNKQLQSLVNNVVAENMDLKNRVNRLEASDRERTKNMELLEKKIDEALREAAN